MAVFFGGVPTGPDVERLIKEVDAQAGSEISYSVVEKIIGVSASENRFRTITNAWRKRLFREKFIQTTAEGQTFKFLNADQAHDRGIKNVWRIGRATTKVSREVDVVDASQLSGQRGERHRLLRRITSEMADFSRKSIKTIAAPKAITSTVRTAPVESSEPASTTTTNH